VAIPIETGRPAEPALTGGRGADGGGGASGGADVAGPIVRTVPRVSPLRGVVLEGEITVTIGGPPARPNGVPVPTSVAPGSSVASGAPAGVGVAARVAPPDEPDGDEPPWPAEAAAALARESEAATLPTEASEGQTLHVRFRPGDNERLVAAFEALRGLLRDRLGETQVVLHIPAGPGREQQMHLRTGVAYDADLVASVRRTLGPDLVELRLA
jgi:hypothetical protein